jgi:Mg2+ and Co2+ transporter CorA
VTSRLHCLRAVVRLREAVLNGSALASPAVALVRLQEDFTGIADRSNRALSALTVISTLLLPPIFVVGAFGMHVGGGP